MYYYIDVVVQVIEVDEQYWVYWVIGFEFVVQCVEIVVVWFVMVGGMYLGGSFCQQCVGFEVGEYEFVLIYGVVFFRLCLGWKRGVY